MKKIFTKSTLKERRQDLRKNMTTVESLLWNKLRNKQIEFKFRRQHSIGIYIVDFYCVEKKLIVELDGKVHLKNKDYDKERDNYLKSLSVNVLRIKNEEVDRDIYKVINKIKMKLNSLPGHGEG